MGNSSTKESRPDARPHPHRATPAAPGYATSALPPDQRPEHPPPRARNRVSRSDLGGLLGISSQPAQPPYERRETKQEREARRLERERQARLVERERSMKEEHVDGGFLVTLGTYVGPEDFSKPIVRQLQVRVA